MIAITVSQCHLPFLQRSSQLSDELLSVLELLLLLASDALELSLLLLLPFDLLIFSFFCLLFSSLMFLI